MELKERKKEKEKKKWKKGGKGGGTKYFTVTGNWKQTIVKPYITIMEYKFDRVCRFAYLGSLVNERNGKVWTQISVITDYKDIWNHDYLHMKLRSWYIKPLLYPFRWMAVKTDINTIRQIITVYLWKGNIM